MSTRRSVVLGVLAWTLVVAAVSGVAWLAIDRAGREVLGPTSLPGAGAAAGPTTVGSGPGPSPDASRSPGGASPTPTPDPTRSPTGTSEASPSASGQPAGPGARTRTVSVDGGRFAVTCEGRRVSLRYATPQEGWKVEVSDEGPEKVEVHFVQRSGGEGECEYTARCEGGSPRVQGDEHGESGEN
jgi:hypothetical protein